MSNSIFSLALLRLPNGCQALRLRQPGRLYVATHHHRQKTLE